MGILLLSIIQGSIMIFEAVFFIAATLLSKHSSVCSTSVSKIPVFSYQLEPV